MRPPPAEADCCGSGCLKCVWDEYYEEMEEEAVHEEEVQVRSEVKVAGPFDPPQNCVRVVGVEDEEVQPGDPVEVLGLKAVAIVSITPIGPHTQEVVLDDTTVASSFPIFTPNPPELVEAVMSRLDYPDRVIKVLPSMFSDGVNAPTYPYWIPQDAAFRLRDILTYFVDLTSPASVRQPVLCVLSSFCSDEGDTKQLSHLASKSGLKEYRQRFRTAEGPGLLAVLNDFPSSKPPIARLLAALPQPRPRLFSNAGQPRSNAVLLYNPSRKGHTSSCLSALPSSVYTGGPYLGAIPPTPPLPPAAAHCLVVSAGVGQSPVIHSLRAAPDAVFWVYHGCRDLDDPHPHLRTAARHSFTPSSKQYVWQTLHDDADALRAFDPLFIYICGPAQMILDTESAVEGILGERAAAIKENGKWCVQRWSLGG